MIDAANPLEAYRSDLAAAGSRETFSANDACWLVVATGLARLATMGPPRSRAILQFANTLDGYRRDVAQAMGSTDARTIDRLVQLATALGAMVRRAPGAAAAAIAAIRGLAEDAEAAGALRLSYAMLSDGRALSNRAGAEETGLLMLQQARIARTLGNLDHAEALYTTAADLGRAHGIALLTARATLARGVIARTRGNYPVARGFFEAALGEAERTGLTELAASAHEALMIATGNAGELDAALAHGRQALEAAEADRDRHAGLVTNLARLALGAGCTLAALGGYLHAARLTAAPRIRLPALSGAALAAAGLGRASQVDRLARLVAEESSESFPYETASAWEVLWRAYTALGASRTADDCRQRALGLARAGGFFEIVYALEREASDAGGQRGEAGRQPLGPRAESVVRSLEAFAVDEDVDTHGASSRSPLASST